MNPGSTEGKNASRKFLVDGQGLLLFTRRIRFGRTSISGIQITSLSLFSIKLFCCSQLLLYSNEIFNRYNFLDNDRKPNVRYAKLAYFIQDDQFAFATSAL
jgi:hypothetical protein